MTTILRLYPQATIDYYAKEKELIKDNQEYITKYFNVGETIWVTNCETYNGPAKIIELVDGIIICDLPITIKTKLNRNNYRKRKNLKQQLYLTKDQISKI